MKSAEEIKKIALKTIQIESDTIQDLKHAIDNSFAKSVELILGSKGRIIVSGIGKSANIGQKIVATLNSTGSPAIFMHASDAIHGDLGNVQKDDVVLCISNSGNTPEIKALLPMIKEFGNTLIAICGNEKSVLAQQANGLILYSVKEEACPNNLAPTSSTTAQLVLGDALAVCLLESKGFTKEDYAKYHPGGSLGKRLYLKVSDIYPANEKPQVSPESGVKQVIVEISSNRLGITAVVKDNKLVGVITDGDIRRMLEDYDDFSKLKALDIMTSSPKTVTAGLLAAEALSIMEKNNITQLAVCDKDHYLGIIHLHDLLKEGIY